MPHSDPLHYLEQAGFRYKPAESPDLWTHLEAQFSRNGVIGPKFVPMTADNMAEVINGGEKLLLHAFVEQHKRAGSLSRIATTMELPFVVGTDAAIPLGKADPERLLKLIDHPGTPKEKIVHAVPASADDIPCTNRVMVCGGLYADGHTAGYFDLQPGGTVKGEAAYHATHEEIASLACEMETRIDNIASVTRRECEAMLARARKLLSL